MMYFPDMMISERHTLLKSTIGTLHMEDEAFEQSFYMSWVFYPFFFIIGLGQILFFYLYNKKFHPFCEILKGVRKQGKICVMKNKTFMNNRYIIPLVFNHFQQLSRAPKARKFLLVEISPLHENQNVNEYNF